MLAAGMPAYFAMDHTRDKEVYMLVVTSYDDSLNFNFNFTYFNFIIFI